jgi:hypothetical protein
MGAMGRLIAHMDSRLHLAAVPAAHLRSLALDGFNFLRAGLSPHTRSVVTLLLSPVQFAGELFTSKLNPGFGRFAESNVSTDESADA